MLSHVFLFAHPDDEFACSGFVEDAVRCGDSVQCIYLTDGGYGGQDTERRRRETAQALASLGISELDIYQLGMAHGFRDGCLHEYLSDVLIAVDQRLMASPFDIAKMILHVPAWEGGHQDHDFTHAIGVALSKRHGCEVRQFPLYNGRGLPGPVFSVVKPIPENGPCVHRLRLGLRRRVSSITLCFYHKSQWRSWLGLLPFFATKMLLFGEFREQAVVIDRIDRRPHEGALLYERRGGPAFAVVSDSVKSLCNC